MLRYVALAVLLSLPLAAHAADAGNGRKLAERHCSRCHVVGDFNPTGGIGSTPSLQWIKKLDDWRERFRTFYARRPHLAFLKVTGIEPVSKLPPYAEPFELTIEETQDIYAFIETLEVPK